MEILQCTEGRFQNICDSTNELISYDQTAYVSTYYERSALRLLTDHGRVFIKGRSGSGKSRLGLRLLSKLSEDKTRVPVLLTSAEEWKLIPKTSGRDRCRYIVMLDNVFGSSNLVPSRVGEWEKTFNIMWPSIESKHIFLVITSRPEISVQCENELKTYNVMKDIPCVTLDEGEYALQLSEKTKMLQTICSIKSGFTQEEIKVVAASKAPLGFPQCCKFFANSKQAQDKRVRFFLRPHEYVLEEINRLQESDGLGYLVLLLILVQNGCMKHTLLKRRTAEFSNIVETLRDVCVDLPENPRLVGLREKADSLCGVYLERTQDGYEFQHQSISECVFITLSKIDTNLCIKTCPVQMLLELVQTKGDYPNVNAMVILLTEDHYPTFADRITTLLLDPTSSKEILNHAAFHDDDFIQCLISTWRSEDKIQAIWQQEIEPKTQLCFSYRGNNVPMFGFRKIVPRMIFKNIKRLVDVLITMNRDNGTDVLQECLPCALYVGRNELVKNLLEYGATPDEHCFRALCPARQLDVDVIETIFNVVVSEDRRFTWESISNLRDLFWLAVMNGNVPVVRLLVKRLKGDTDSLMIFKSALVDLVRELSTGHRCPLFKPYDMRHLREIVRILLDTGCKVDFDYLTLQAAAHADPTVLRLVLEQGVHVKDIYIMEEDIYSTEDYYPTPLQQAAAYGGGECLEELLRCTHGGQEQKREVINSNEFLLHTAVQHGNTECASLLLKKGIPVNTQDRRGNTPLHVAVKHKQVSCIELLLSEHASVDMKNSNGCVPLLYMEHESPPDLNIVTRLIKAGSDINEVDEQGRTLLYKATEFGHFATVRYLCNKGANVNIDTQHGDIPHIAITEERSLCKRIILAACRNADIDIVKLLCEHGADVDVADVNGETVMHKAAASTIDAVEKLQYLLDTKQVPLSKKDHFGRTVLFPAVMSALQNGHLEVLHFLASREMDFKQIDRFGNSLLLHAVGRLSFDIAYSVIAPSGGFLKLMLNHGIDPNIKNQQGRTVLHYAAIKGDTNKLTILLEGGADPCVPDEKGRTVLHRAVMRRDFKNARLFLENGANPDVQDNTGKTALHFAGELKDSETVKLLLEKGADLSVSDKYGRNALHYAVKSQDCVVMKLLLQHGASPCVQDMYGTTVLHTAAKCLDRENVMLLLEHDANPHIQDQHCQTTLNFAARNTNSDVLKLFLERGVDSSVQDDRGWTALHSAVLYCYTKHVEILLERCQEWDLQDNEGKTPLHHAAETEYSDIVRLLLDKNLDPCVQDHNGETPLHYAAKNGHNESVQFIVNKGADVSLKNKEGMTVLHYVSSINKDNVKQLLAHNADPNAKDHSGRTPLHLATMGNRDDRVKLLLDNGADPCLKDDGGKTSLHMAAIHNLDSTALLMEKGAVPLVQDKEGKTPLHYAAEHDNWECANLLLENGGDPCIKDQQGKTALHAAIEADYGFNVFGYNGISYRYISKEAKRKQKSIAKLLVDKGCSHSLTDNQGKTALHYAAAISNCDNLQLLLNDNAAPFIKDKQGKTPLHYAAAKGIGNNVNLLLEKGADPNAIDQQGKTPLHCAAETGHGDSIQVLLDKGADTRQLDNEWRTPLHYAAASDSSFCLRLLLNKACVTTLSDQRGKTALHYAAEGRCTDNVRLLLQNGADPFVTDQQGLTALNYATRGEHTTSVRLLKGSINPKQ